MSGIEELIPEWLNRNFFNQVLTTEENRRDICITKYDIDLAVPKGDHFSSRLYRAIVEYRFLDETKSKEIKTQNLIIKTLPTGEVIRKIISEAGSFKRETTIYKFILPAMYKLQEEKFGPASINFTSVCLYSEKDIIVLSDLCQYGYQMCDKRKGYDMAHCKVALKSLARFHGLSVGLFQQNPEIMKDMCEFFYIEEQRSSVETYIVTGIKCLGAVVGKWAGFERFEDKIKQVAETATDRLIDVVKPIPESLSVLNHGDFWKNNILFRYDENTNEIIDAMFVDFQVSRFSSPCLDLQFFMCTTPIEDIRHNHMEELLQFYHRELVETLSTVDCGHNQYSFPQFQKEFDEKGIFGFLTASILLQVVLSDPDESIDLDQVKEEDMTVIEGNALEKGFNDPVFREHYQNLLIYYEEKGVI